MWIPSPEPPQRLLRRKHSGAIFSAELQDRLDGLQDFITLEAVFYDFAIGTDQDEERDRISHSGMIFPFLTSRSRILKT